MRQYLYYIRKVDENEFNKRFENLIFFNAILATIALGFNFTTLKSPSLQQDVVEIRFNIWDSLSKIIMAKEAIFDFLSISSFIGLSWCYTMLFGTQQYYLGYRESLLNLSINLYLSDLNQTLYLKFNFLFINYYNIYFQVGQIVAAFYCIINIQQLIIHGNYKSNPKLEFNKIMITTQRLQLVQDFGCLFSKLFYLKIPPLQFWFSSIFLLELVQEDYTQYYQNPQWKSIFQSKNQLLELFLLQLLTVSISITMTLVIPKFLQYGFQISCFLMIIPFCYIAVFYKTQFKRFEAEA